MPIEKLKGVRNIREWRGQKWSELPNINAHTYMPYWCNGSTCRPADALREETVRFCHSAPVASVMISIPNNQSDVSLSSGSKHERPIVTAMPKQEKFKRTSYYS